MSALVPFLLFCQALGAFIGAGTAIWGEIAYVRAMRDGKVDHAERAHIDIIAHGLRFGMSLLLVASLGLVVAAYLLQGVQQPALSASYWTFIGLALLIIWASQSLSRKRLSFSLGSAIIFTAWWFLVYLALGLLPALSFGSAVAFFVVAGAIFYALLHYGRFLVLRK